MSGRVSLPMYDLPGLQLAWDDWWRAMCRAMVKKGIGGLEEGLTRYADLMAHWRDPGMLLSQTCGYPYKLGLDRDWRLAATPVYAVTWCDGPYYRNLILVRDDDSAEKFEELQGRRIAYNSPDSHSGYNSVRSMAAPLAEGGRFFAKAIQTGGHLSSICALAAGEVDCCSVDCVTFALIARHAIVPTEGLRVLVEGPSVPGLPFILPRSTADTDVERIRSGLMRAAASQELSALNRDLLIDGFAAVPETEYSVILEMEKRAAALGYPALD